jgi:hypothetical protein
MSFSVPHDSRSLFELFAAYSEEKGLDDLLARIDVTDLTPRQIYAAVLGRRPENLRAASVPPDYRPRDHLRGTLRSDEFQTKALRLLLDAYPEKRRLLFVHVPKCAGTDLRIALSERYPSIDSGLGNPRWTTQSKLFATIHHVALNVRFCDTILVHGHVRLLRAVEDGLVRPHDQVISVIRDPLEIVISGVNYIITRILQDQEAGTFAPDTKGWLGRLGVARLPSEITSEAIAETWKTLLHDPNVVIRDPICHWLGNGDLRSFVNRVVINDVEITDTPHYTAWLRERWGIQREARANESIHFMTRDMIDAGDMDYIESLIAEDRKVYAMISEAITQSGRTSIRGSEFTGIDCFF